MANQNKQPSFPKRSGTIQRTPLVGAGWLSWMLTWNGKQDVGGHQLEDNSTGSAENAVPRMDVRTHNAEDQWLANERRSDNRENWKFEMNPRNMMVSQFMSSLVDRNNLAIERANINPETDSKATLADDIAKAFDRKKENADLEKATKEIAELKENNAILVKELLHMKKRHQQNIYQGFDDDWKKEEDIFIKKELCTLRDHVYRMEQKTKTIDESMLSQNVKLKNTIHKLQICAERVSTTSMKSDLGSEAEHKTVNDRLNKLENNAKALKSEKRSLILKNRRMTKEIKSNKRKHSVCKKVFNAFGCQMKKDLDNIKRHLHSLKTSKDKDNGTTINIARHKYDKLKLRLSMVERMMNQMLQNMMIKSYAYPSGERNESITNVHCDAKVYSPHSLSSYSPSPSAPPKIPPPPPFQPPAPQAGPSNQYSRYTINSDILKAMTKELRKPDKNNVRKIPRRGDMNIPIKVTTTTKQDVPLPSLALTLPLLAPDLPVEPTEPSAPALTLIAPESPVEPPSVSEISATIDSESRVESPEPPTITLVAPKSPVEPLVPSEISIIIDPESRVETSEPPTPAITLVALESPVEPLVPSEMSLITDAESHVEPPESPTFSITLITPKSSAESLEK